MPRDAAETPRRRRTLLRRLFRFTRNALAVIGLAFLVYHACFEFSHVVSPSMSPTLQGEGGPGGDWLLCEKVSYWFRSPRRWEVMQFTTKDELVVAKRVIGLPGESVSIVDKQLRINDVPVSFPPSLTTLRYIPYGNLARGQRASCDTGYFVLGDFTRDSQDSRFEGPVPPARIRSRPWLIVWPPDRIGFVNP